MLLDSVKIQKSEREEENLSVYFSMVTIEENTSINRKTKGSLYMFLEETFLLPRRLYNFLEDNTLIKETLHIPRRPKGSLNTQHSNTLRIKPLCIWIWVARMGRMATGDLVGVDTQKNNNLKS